MDICRFDDATIVVNDNIYKIIQFPYDLLDVTFYSRNKIVHMPINYIGMCDLIDVRVRDNVDKPLLHIEKNVMFYSDDYKRLYRIVPNVIGRLPHVSGKITGMFYGLQDIDWLDDHTFEHLMKVVKNF